MKIPLTFTHIDEYYKSWLSRSVWVVLVPTDHLLTSMCLLFLPKCYFSPAFISIFFKNHFLRKTSFVFCLQLIHSLVYTYFHLVSIFFFKFDFLKRATVVFSLPDTNFYSSDCFLVFYNRCCCNSGKDFGILLSADIICPY